ncbi:MAG TPA: NAD(P)/FAD-dependent oxidoreductase [Bacillota bacterium]|nr:NAD(P)/FAD-dependent oxidoreductase [Bacillota bacterium]
MDKRRVIVVGGGAAGMVAAIRAAENDAHVILLERNEKLGKKLNITGKGRCNLTNDCTAKELVANIPGNGKFLFSAFHEFDSQKCQAFFTNLGVELKVERGKRVFPVSDQAATVVQALQKRLLALQVEIHYLTRVTQLWLENGLLKGVIAGNQPIAADAVILATGGNSYPMTGSTGDGYAFAKKAGHTIVALRPSLVPLLVKEEWVKELQGLSLRNVDVSLWQGDSKLAGEFGEMLFTHFGVSGPLILSLSRALLDRKPEMEVKLSINLKPALKPEQLDLRLQRDFFKYQNKQFKNGLDDLLPQSLIPVIVLLSGIEPEKQMHFITKTERQHLVALLMDFRMTITGTRPLTEAIVTAGGVETKEIAPKTMESKKIAGLYFAGELLDVDGLTGGFNLQSAFASGYAAGFWAAQV